MSRPPRALLVGFAVLLCGVAEAFAQPAPSLGTAASFAVLGGSAVNAGASTITGNLGVSPGNTITGSPTVKLGAIFRDDAVARQAQRDNAAAYQDLASRTGPGVYRLSSLSGTLTLDAGGDPDAVWIFQAATTLTTAPDSSVRVINGGYEGNVFWQVGDSATLGERTIFVGSILARNNITLKSGASLSGRALAQTGSVTLNGNNVSLCCKPITLAPATLADGKVCTPYGPTTITAIGGTGSYEFSVPPGALPEGLSLSPGGVLSGTPSKVGEKTLPVTAKDKVTECLGISVYKIRVTCDLPFTFSPTTLPAGTVGVQYMPITISASDGPCVKGPLTFRASEELARIGLWLSLDGVLMGKPSEAGDFTFTVTAIDEASGCVGTHEYTVRICAAITISPMTLPNAIVGKEYSETITASGGTPRYTFSVIPALPAPDFKLTETSSTTAVISWKPTAQSELKFTVTATDDRGCSATREYTITIDICPVISLSPSTLHDATPDVFYMETIVASNGTKPYTYIIAPETLPKGLVPPRDPATGLISGTPTKDAVSSNFTVNVTDANSCPGSRLYTICLPIIILPETLPDPIAGVPYNNVKLTATGGAGPDYEFSPQDLPYGLNLHPITGVISGTPSISPTPSAASGYAPLMAPPPGSTFTVTAVDKVTKCKGMRTYTLRLTCPTIAISPPTLPSGNLGTLYSQAITAIGGTAPHTFTVASGSLPPGLTLTSGGALSGTPTTTGTYCFSVATTDAAGCSGGPVDYTIVISAATCPAGTIIILSPPTLPSAPTGMPYSQMITASGGTSPYTFSVTSGALPPGLTLNPVTGLVSGTPTTGGTYTLTIAATDANGCVGSMGCSISMNVDIPGLSGWGMVVLSIVLFGIGLVATQRSAG